MYTARAKTGHMMSVCNLEFGGQTPRSRDAFSIFWITDILDIEYVRIGTKINFVSCLLLEIRKVMQKGD